MYPRAGLSHAIASPVPPVRVHQAARRVRAQPRMAAPGDTAALNGGNFLRTAADAAALTPAAQCNYLRQRGARALELQAPLHGAYARVIARQARCRAGLTRALPVAGVATGAVWPGARTSPALCAEAPRLCDERAPGAPEPRCVVARLVPGPAVCRPWRRRRRRAEHA